jgi:hypothetical protein
VCTRSSLGKGPVLDSQSSLANEAIHDNSGQKPAMKMSAYKRIVKKVFAGIKNIKTNIVPYRYRMDVKDGAVQNDFSYPLGYNSK